MRKILVFQHVAREILGTLNPLLKKEKFRVRYVNFERDLNHSPSIEKYNGLIVLGGYMGVYEANTYTHIKTEAQLVEKALKKNIPILGICFGAQLLAHVLGAEVKRNHQKEIGWYDLNLTAAGTKDPLLGHFSPVEKVFQMHGDTFSLPAGATHLASSQLCEGQAFSYGERAYGLQFHLEVDKPMIQRWLTDKRNLDDLSKSHGQFSAVKIASETDLFLARSIEMSRATFKQFIALFGERPRHLILGSDHAKPAQED